MLYPVPKGKKDLVLAAFEKSSKRLSEGGKDRPRDTGTRQDGGEIDAKLKARAKKRRGLGT